MRLTVKTDASHKICETTHPQLLVSPATSTATAPPKKTPLYMVPDPKMEDPDDGSRTCNHFDSNTITVVVLIVSYYLVQSALEDGHYWMSHKL